MPRPRRLSDIYDIRLKIYVWKFVMKFLNNAINQLGPFAFYSIGGGNLSTREYRSKRKRLSMRSPTFPR